jgi:hypothetical protein
MQTDTEPDRIIACARGNEALNLKGAIQGHGGLVKNREN